MNAYHSIVYVANFSFNIDIAIDFAGTCIALNPVCLPNNFTNSTALEFWHKISYNIIID